MPLTRPATTTRSNRGFQLSPRARVEDGDAKTNAGVTVRAPQPKLQIEDEKIRRHPMPPLHKARMILDAAPARTAHHDDFVRGQVAEPQPSMIALCLIRLHKNKL
jgi:hypothetical protein